MEEVNIMETKPVVKKTIAKVEPVVENKVKRLKVTEYFMKKINPELFYRSKYCIVDNNGQFVKNADNSDRYDAFQEGLRMNRALGLDRIKEV